MSRRNRFFLTTSVLASAALLSACASFPTLQVRPTPPRPERRLPDGSEGLTLREKPQAVDAQMINIPKTVAAPAAPSEREATPEQIAALFPANTQVTATLPPQAVPLFLDTALGDVLKVPYSLGPGVAQRPQIISVRSAINNTQQDFFRLLQTALRDYGLRMYIRGGLVAVLDDQTPESPTATVLRSRSSADTPVGSRTVVQFFQLQALDALAVQQMLQDLFPGTRAVKITPEQLSNSLVISGPARDVASTIQVLSELDKPAFAGSQVARLQPVFWKADDFAKALESALNIEGFKTSTQIPAPRAIMILPLPSVNQILVFVNDPKIMERVQFWARELDQPSKLGDQRSNFVYVVRNTDAKNLGGLITGQGAGATNVIQTPVGVAGGPTDAGGRGGVGSSLGGNSFSSGPSGGQVPSGGSIIIDPIGNRILFSGTAAQFAQVRSLLEQLDVPPPQVMIEVTVAEVTLTDSSRLGLEWFFTHSANNGGVYSGGTEGGLSLGNSGLSLKFTGPDLRANFNAFASNQKVNILSTPKLVTMSGIESQLQVGTDVPIITSQAAGTVQTGGTTSVLQTVQYRQTGIILHVKPVVYGDNRVDLEISQEVSNQTASTNAAIASPSILNRSISTKLSVIDGATSVLGGLMDDNFTKANNGIPFAKDIPILGQAFRTDTIDGTKTELVILVTPFIIRDADQMSDLAGRLTGEMNAAFRVGRGGSYTLTAVSTGHNLGLALPPPRGYSAPTQAPAPADPGPAPITPPAPTAIPPATTEPRPPSASTPVVQP